MTQYNDFVAKIRQNKATLILIGLLVSSLSFIFLLANEKNFKVGTEYLVIQKSQNTTDTYALAKSAEYMGKILSEGIHSELFINEVIKTGKVNSEFLPFEKREKLKSWEKMVLVSQDADLGIIKINVFENDQRSALGVSEAISEVMTTKNQLFRAENQDIEVKILTGPVIERNPGMGNIAAAIIAGFIFGIMLTSVWFFSQAGKKKTQYSSRVVYENYDMEDKREAFSTQPFFQEDENYIESIRNFQG